MSEYEKTADKTKEKMEEYVHGMIGSSMVLVFMTKVARNVR